MRRQISQDAEVGFFHELLYQDKSLAAISQRQ
jgi:hypothetical protein